MVKKKQVDLTRADQLVVDQGLAPDLPKARALIMAGQVIACAHLERGESRIEKASQKLATATPLRLKEASKAASRAGEKLLGALDDLGLTPAFATKVVLDVGCSTGGFTDISLRAGARLVHAVDVGVGQLLWRLRQDPRVRVHEGQDIRELKAADLQPIDIVLADISFNSLARLVPHLVELGGKDAIYLCLVKPQFELPKDLVPKGGVVKDDQLRQQALELVRAAFVKAGIQKFAHCDSRLPGRQGNREIFLLAQIQS